MSYSLLVLAMVSGMSSPLKKWEMGYHIQNVVRVLNSIKSPVSLDTAVDSAQLVLLAEQSPIIENHNTTSIWIR